MKDVIERILVPADGSPASESAFAAIMPLVRAYAPEVAVLHVLEDPEASFMPPAQIAKACGALRASNVNAYLELREGLPAEEILRVAREKKVDLIAMSTHGRGGVVRLIVGSVAEQVLRRTEVPLLVTRPGTPVHDWKKIVVALDGSALCEAVLEDAVQLAHKLGASIELLRIALPTYASAAGEVPVMVPPEDPLPYLKKIAARLEAEGIKVGLAGPEGRASDGIVRHLTDTHAGLLCMTTHGRGGLARILMGSVAEDVLRRSPCPVLLRRSIPAGKAVATSPKKKKGVKII
jgi:nucleotide-binding universal stress UspA family protein